MKRKTLRKRGHEHDDPDSGPATLSRFRTAIKAGGLNLGQPTTRGLKVRTAIKAGGFNSANHNQTR